MAARSLIASLLVVLMAAPLAAFEPEGEAPLADRFQGPEAPTHPLREDPAYTTREAMQLPGAPTSASVAGMDVALGEAPPPPPQEQYFTLDELKDEMKKVAWTKGDYQIVPYGILWGTMSYETGRTFVGDFPQYVLPRRPKANEQFHLDGRSTRLGIDFGGPQIPLFNCAKSGGKVEIDFQRMIDTENKPSILLRHAYLEVKDEQFRLLFGQTWDVISPLYPGVLMYSVGWGGGNIGYRRAQFRGERYLAFSDVMLLTLQGSLNSDIITDAGADFAGDHSGWPVLEGRVALTLGERGAGMKPIEFGVSGHIGEQIFDFRSPWLNPVTGLPRRTWSFNADVRIPIGERWGVQGEFFTGENLGAFLGGALQGIDAGTQATPGSRDPIRSTGGWFDVWWDITSRMHTHVGYAIDDPFNQDVTVGRLYNAFAFANVSYDLTQKFLIGLEFTSWKTLWAAPANNGDSQRIEFVAKYGF